MSGESRCKTDSQGTGRWGKGVHGSDNHSTAVAAAPIATLAATVVAPITNSVPIAAPATAPIAAPLPSVGPVHWPLVSRLPLSYYPGVGGAATYLCSYHTQPDILRSNGSVVDLQTLLL